VIAGLTLDNPDIGAVSIPLEEYLARTNTTAFIILHGDQILYEGYFNGSDREAIQPSFSASKSFFAALIGIAIDEGYLSSQDDPITNYLPELLESDPIFEVVTIKDLLSMTSGIQWERSESNPLSDDFLTYYSPNLRATALEAKIETQPGSVFQYNDYNPLLLGMALERATGLSVAEYMETRLWQPMGAEGQGSWSLDSETSGFEKTFAGFNGRALDLVKLGWIYLNNGQNGSVEVVPSSWVAQVADQLISSNQSPEYQDYWWVDSERNMYFAEGDKCQFIYVYPQAQLVLARFGKDCGGTGFTDFMANIALWIETQLAE
jgi:CubicO group peptidase (beta-lactamase class C family)